jgi:HprK-related kinase A
MPKLKDLAEQHRNVLLREGALQLCVGPYIYRLQSDLPSIRQGLASLYGDFALAEAKQFNDYNVSVRHTGPVARWRGRVEFFFDNSRPFSTFEQRNAYAFMEWGMNWCVSIHANEYLKLHAAVVAKQGSAVVMPGIPGAGKSTLCAALGLSGWRVLSDEHALVPPGTAQVVPLYRPVSLKNESIRIIKAFAHNAVLGPQSGDTHKGIVAHLKADLAPDSHDPAPLPVKTMVFPRYSAVEPQQLTRRSRTSSFILAAFHSFNYSLLGPVGFNAMQTLIDAADCYDLVYNDLEWAIRAMDQLHDGSTG